MIPTGEENLYVTNNTSTCHYLHNDPANDVSTITKEKLQFGLLWVTSGGKFVF